MSANDQYNDPIDPRPLDPEDVTDSMALSEDEEREGEIISDEGSIQQINFQDWPAEKRNQAADEAPPEDPDQYLSGSEDESIFGAL